MMPSPPGTILAIEAASGGLSVAILRGEETLAEVEEAPGVPAAERLLEGIDELLGRACLSLGDLQGIAVSVGPGSFTGIRVGLATVKGLAFEPELPVAPVSTLAALAAEAMPRPEPVGALLDARRGEVYAAVFPGEAPGGLPCLEEGLFHPDELVARLPIPCTLLGEGLALVESALGPGTADRVTLLRGGRERPRAVQVGRLGARIFARGGGVRADDVQPRYLRRAQAEVQRTGHRAEGPPRPRPL